MKRLITALLAAALFLTPALPAHAASSYIRDASRLRGADYTNIPALASALDTVFSGAPKMYADIRCTTLAPAPIGSRNVPLGRTYYVKSPSGSVYSGTSCYIYANAVYATLFGDVPYHGEPGSWVDSRRVGGNIASASYDTFASLGVRCGALMRTTSNSDGSYNGNTGHSMIVLTYDRSGITYLEGNGDGNGLIQVTTRSWDTFNSSTVSGRGYKISFIVQPTQSYYDSLLTGDKKKPSQLVGYLSRTKTGGGFADVPTNTWFASGVTLCRELGLAEGRSGTVFDPNGTVTVSEAVAFCARFLSLYYADGYGFTPTDGAWYSGYYQYCALWGIDTSFAKPFDVITRGDFILLMSKALPKEAREDAVPDAGFTDVPQNARYASAVRELARAGIVAGSGGGLLQPAQGLTRAEAATFLARMADRSLRLG